MRNRSAQYRYQIFRSLAQKEPGVYPSHLGERSSPGRLQVGETTIVGDPDAKEKDPAGSQMTGEAEPYKLPWEPLTYYNPPRDKLPELLNILQPKGYQYIAGVGLVPPNEVGLVKARLAQGWLYAGPGYGLVPKEWMAWLKAHHYI